MSTRARCTRSRTRWRGTPPNASLNARVAATAPAIGEPGGVRACSDAARRAVSGIVPARLAIDSR